MLCDVARKQMPPRHVLSPGHFFRDEPTAMLILSNRPNLCPAEGAPTTRDWRGEGPGVFRCSPCRPCSCESCLQHPLWRNLDELERRAVLLFLLAMTLVPAGCTPSRVLAIEPDRSLDDVVTTGRGLSTNSTAAKQYKGSLFSCLQISISHPATLTSNTKHYINQVNQINPPHT